MSLESPIVNVGDLNPLWPTGAESKNEGDDHLRNIKKVIKQAFAGFTGAVVVTGTDGGAVNAYTLTPATALLAYTSRTMAVFSPTITSTGAVTLNVSGLGAKSVLSIDGAALVSGDLVVGSVYVAVYNGTAFQLIAPTKNYIDQLVVSGTLPGVATPANAGKFYKTDGAVGSWASIDLRGQPTTAKPVSGVAAQVFDYAAGEGQSMTATGSFSFTATGFPAGRTAGILIMATNWGAFAPTSSGITWFKSDGTTTTNFNTSGITLPSAGVGKLALWSLDGVTIYGQAV